LEFSIDLGKGELDEGKRFTEEQIIAVLKEHEAGAPTKDLCRRHGISEQRLYRWKAKFGGMDVSDAKKMRALEDENRRPKHIVAEARSPVCTRHSPSNSHCALQP
jgi:putative transposase